MIYFTTGNLLAADADVLVNTVNEIGVMGKGIALAVRDKYPVSARRYQDACRRGEVRVGRVLVTESGVTGSPRWIIHFPTKKHWRGRSQLPWIEHGLESLIEELVRLGASSVAVPPLGCGNGGLRWIDVRPLIEAAFSRVPSMRVVVYEPTGEYQTQPKVGKPTKLTVSRALLIEALRRYGVVAGQATVLEAQKLAWFLVKATAQVGLKDPLRLDFVAGRYGPYADALRHVIDALDGSYLHAAKRMGDAGPFDELWVEGRYLPEVSAFVDSSDPRVIKALDTLLSWIDGFESPYGMELLATVDWLLDTNTIDPTVDAVRAALRSWGAGEDAGARKLDLFAPNDIRLAIDRIVAVRSHLLPLPL